MRAQGDAEENLAGRQEGGRIEQHAVLAKLSYSLRSDPGIVRSGNEDFVAAWADTAPEDAWSQGPVFAVADGMGGHAAGEVASEVAARAVVASWRRSAGRSAQAGLRAALREANLAVAEAASAPGRRGMGTTLTALALVGQEAVVAHVGDSRAYLVRRGAARQLTTDHSQVAEMVRRGLITPEQARSHPARSVLSRALGVDLMVPVDVVTERVERGDVLVLCTDGLWSLVGSEELARTVAGLGSSADLVDASASLVALALERGAPDNVSVALVRISSDLPIAPPSRRRPVLGAPWRRRALPS